jgi:hypothetical protein
MSSGSPMRASGMRGMERLATAGSRHEAPMPSPAVAPGQMQFTRTPRPPYWPATRRVSEITPPLEAV